MASSIVQWLRKPRFPSTDCITHSPFRRKNVSIHTKRYFSTRPSLCKAFGTSYEAAKPLDLDNPVMNHEIDLLQRIRVVPKSPSYFSAKEKFFDTYLEVEKLWLQTSSLPRVSHPPSNKWITFPQMQDRLGKEVIGKTRFEIMIDRLRRLSQIEPVLMPMEVKAIIEDHSQHVRNVEKLVKQERIDEWGRSLGMGKRKAAVARAYLVMGDGQVLINNRNIVDYFERLHDRESALWALKITERMHRYNVFGIVNGGGLTGQAEAMTLAVTRALIAHEPKLAQRLKSAGCLYRDPRVVERKKTGLRKARKAPQWVKR